jgi:hypothetical protein
MICSRSPYAFRLGVIHYITSKLSAGVPREIIAGIVGIDERTIATYNHAKSADFAKLAVEKYGL